ncbi:MAG: hypothetical protein AB1345_04810 [Chloroflexota bacterium]
MMKTPMTAIELNGEIDEERRLHVDSLLPFPGPRRVRVIVLTEPLGDEWGELELNEVEWLRVAARNPLFAFLNDPEEDIYTLEDGKPFRDEV